MQDTQTDVIVIGGGGAGMFAALAARRRGRTVVIVEKNSHLGGTTIRSIGSITSSGTELQRQAGITDTTAAHFEDMAKFQGNLGPRDNPELRRVLAENVPETFRQLLELGLTFIGPLPEPPHRVPRMHAVLPNSQAYGYHLSKAVRSAGIVVKLQCRAKQLLLQDKAVRGVVVMHPDGSEEILRARNGVVVASGDFSAGKEMKAQYINEVISEISAINPSSTGDGHRLAIEAGAEVVNGDLFAGIQMRFIAPPRNFLQRLPPYKPFAALMKWSMKAVPARLLRPFLMMFVTTMLEPQRGLFEAGALLINRDGRRFTEECSSPQFDIHRQPGGDAFLLLDDALARKFSAAPHFVSIAPGVAFAYMPDYEKNRSDIYTRAASLDALAVALKMPADVLKTSIAEANQRSLPEGRQLIGAGPYHVLGPLKSWIGTTEGGLRVSTDLQVLHRDGGVIPGLFAAGSVGQGGLVLEGRGNHLAWAFTSGRLAGEGAADFRAAS